MTLPVPNQTSPLVNPKTGTIVPPWNSFFQQFSQNAPDVADVTISPFTANANGSVILTGATTVSLTRGTVTIDLTGQMIVPISIGDTVDWTGPATVQFLGA